MVFGRRNKEETPAPPQLDRRWRVEIESAEASRRQFDAIVERTPEGPVREQLGALGADLDRVTEAIDTAAHRAQNLSETLGVLDIDGVTRRLKEARRDLARAEDAGADTTELAARAESFDRQLASMHAVWDRIEASAADLHRHQLTLDETVALAGVIATHPVHEAEREVVDLRLRLQSLHSALDELATD